MRRLGLVGFVCLLLMAGLTALSSPAHAYSLICSAKTKAQVAKCDTSGYAAVMSKMHWRMYGGHNCTNYAAYRMQRAGVPEPAILMGNARDWAKNARKLGYTVNQKPAVGAIGQWKDTSNHVAYVEEVGPDHLILSDDSYGSKVYKRYRVNTGDSWYPERFIHFLEPGATAPVAGPAPAPAPPKVVSTSVSVTGPAKVSTRIKPTVAVRVAATGGVVPEGRVRVRRGGRTVATATLTAASKGTVNVRIPRMKRGKQWISAVFDGGGNAKSSTSRTIGITVKKPPKVVSSTTKISHPSTVVAGTRAMATINIRAKDGRAMSNTASIYVDGKRIAVRKINKKNKGTVKAWIPALAPGNHSIRATYWGTKKVRRSQSATTAFTVAEETAVSTTLAKPTVGSKESTTVTATVSTGRGVAPVSGEVWVLADGTKVAAAALTRAAKGTVTIALPVLAPGTRQISVAYQGAPFQLASTSTGLSLVVMEPTSTATALSATSVKTTARAKLTVKVLSGSKVAASSGTIVVKDGSKQIATVALKPAHQGKITITLPRLAAGSHRLTAVFGGTDSLEPSSSGARTLKVTT